MSSEMSNKDYFQYLPIIVGWALGIFSALIVEIIKRWSLKKEIKKGILTELRELQSSIIGLCISTTTGSDKVTIEWSKWIKPFYTKVFDTDDIDYLKLNKKGLSEIAKMSDEQFYRFMTTWHPGENSRVSFTFSQISIPYLNSKYDFISNYDQKFQLLIAKLRKQIDTLNNDFTQCWFYHSKTFDKITDLNHAVVVQNGDKIVARIANKTKGMIILLQKIIDY